MSDPAAAQIRRFSRIVWIAGAIAVALIAFFAIPPVFVLADGRVVVDDGGGRAGDRIFPQHEDDALALTWGDGTISGDRRGGWLPFAADAEPIALRMPHEHPDYVHVFQTADAAELETAGIAPAESLGSLWDTEDIVYAVPSDTDGRLWISAGSDWELTVEPLQSTPIVDAQASGTGDAVLSYRGDALSARFAHTGSGFLRVRVLAPELNEVGVNDVDDFTKRTSWPRAGTVLFMIESSGGEWSVAVDE